MTIQTRRRLIKYRAKHGGVRAPELEEPRRTTRSKLKAAIWKAKERAWQELVDSINNEPWSRPYKLVRNKLIRETPPLEQEEIEEILDSLFSSDKESFRIGEWMEKLDDGSWNEANAVNGSEMRRAIKHAGREGGKAPGSDGITSNIWRKVVDEAPEVVAGVLSCCLKKRKFPKEWKKGDWYID